MKPSQITARKAWPSTLRAPAHASIPTHVTCECTHRCARFQPLHQTVSSLRAGAWIPFVLPAQSQGLDTKSGLRKCSSNEFHGQTCCASSLRFQHLTPPQTHTHTAEDVSHPTQAQRVHRHLTSLQLQPTLCKNDTWRKEVTMFSAVEDMT